MLDPEVNPSLYTPMKHMWLLSSAMASMSSGSYLITKTPLTAAQASQIVMISVIEQPTPLLEPDWSLLALPDGTTHLSQAQVEQQNEKLTNSLRLA
jgi:hypothetical protein